MKKITLFALLYALTWLPAFSQAPANDGICGHVTLTVGGGCIAGDNTNSTTEGLSVPSCWNGPPSNYSNSVWYSFVATDDSITVNPGGIVLGTQANLAIYSSSNGTCSGLLTEVGCSRGGNEANLTGLTIGVRYFVMLDGQGTNVGDFCISAYETPPPPPPIGAICTNPRDLYPASDCNNVQGTQYDEQSNIIQTDPATGGDAGQGVTNPPYVPSGIDGTCTTDNDGTQMPYWIRFTATVTTSGGNFTRITNSGNCPQDYTVFSGTCGALTQTNCFANVAAGGTVNLTVTAGVTYYVMITNSNGSTCTNRFMCLTSSVPYTPPNDNCASALTVTAGTVYNLSNANATADRNLCSGSMENNIWTVWTCPSGWTGSAYVHLFNQDCACGNGLQMSIYTASVSCPPNANPTCMLTLNPNNDNDFYGQFTPVPGNTYYMTIDGYAGCACNFDFTILNTPVLLPASGVVVNAVRAGQDVLLRWTAEAETHVSHYEILKDVGGNGWVSLDQVAARGHSPLPVSYAWTHPNAPQSYVRYGIRSIDMDGAQSEITQVSVYPGNARTGLIGIHPQPAGEEVYALLNLEKAAPVRWSISDTRGRILLQGEQYCQEGSTTLTLDLRDLPTGMYFLGITHGADGSRETVRLLK